MKIRRSKTLFWDGVTQCQAARGNVTSTFVPAFTPLAIAIVPPFRSTNFFARGKPIPVPWGLVVKNGSKTRSRFSAGMPSPVSSIESCTTAPAPLWSDDLVPDRHASALRSSLERIRDQHHQSLFQLIHVRADAGRSGI